MYYKLITVSLIIVVLLLFFGGSALFRLPVGLIKSPASQIFSGVSSFSRLIGELKHLGELTAENKKLRELYLKLDAQSAQIAGLTEEISFLRAVYKLPPYTSYDLIDAGAFGFSFTPEGHSLLINKGADEGLKSGAAAISSSGALIGQVDQVFSGYSRVIVLTDPNFKVMVSLGESAVSGIGLGDLTNGVYIDFISRSDAVSEGALALTSGGDLLPAGILIGKVSLIGENDGNVFKKIYVKPAFKTSDLSKVIILQKQLRR